MSYNDPYARQRPDQQPYDPYYTAADQHVNYNNSYPPSNNNNHSNPAWNEVSGPSQNQYDSSYAPERLSRTGVSEPPPKCAHSPSLLRLSAAADYDTSRDTGELRLWRHSEHGHLWTKVCRWPWVQSTLPFVLTADCSSGRAWSVHRALCLLQYHDDIGSDHFCRSVIRYGAPSFNR